MHVALRGNISAPVRATDLVEASKDAASLLVCTRKKIFCLGNARKSIKGSKDSDSSLVSNENFSETL